MQRTKLKKNNTVARLTEKITPNAPRLTIMQNDTNAVKSLQKEHCDVIDSYVKFEGTTLASVCKQNEQTTWKS